jgi:hypothetical protein
VPADPEATDDDGRRIGDGFGALGDLWQFGLDTTRTMADRVQDLYAGLASGRAPTAGIDDELRQLRIDLERVVDLSVDVFDRLFQVARRVERRDDTGPEATEAVSIRAAPGAKGTAAVWVHNVSVAEHPSPDLRCGPLTMFDGTELPPDGVHLVGSPDPIAANNSRQLDLVVEIPGDAVPGVYHGLVLARAPEASIRVRVEVTDGDDA